MLAAVTPSWPSLRRTITRRGWQELLGQTFYAFRLTVEVSGRTDVGGKVLLSLGANSAGEALDKALF